MHLLCLFTMIFICIINLLCYSFFLFFDRPKAWPRSGKESEALHAIPIVSLYPDIYQQKTGHNSYSKMSPVELLVLYWYCGRSTVQNCSRRLSISCLLASEIEQHEQWTKPQETRDVTASHWYRYITTIQTFTPWILSCWYIY